MRAEPAQSEAIQPAPVWDLVIRGGTVVDGSGGEPFVGDVAILGGTIAAVGAS